MARPPATEIAIPPEFADLPNPRGFRPVALQCPAWDPPLDWQPLLPQSRIPAGEVQEVRVALSDGCQLRVRCALPRGVTDPPLLILLHMWGMDADSWERRAPGLGADLLELGFAWCAPDLRWHGQSDGEPHCATFADWQAARQLPQPARAQRLAALAEQGPALGANVRFLRDLADLRRWWRATEWVHPARWGIIGASVGANCAWVASHLYDAAAHVAISPWYPSPGWSLMGREVADFRPHNVLFMADGIEAPEAEQMAALTGWYKEVRIGTGKEHGIGLLRQLPLRRRMFEVLRERI